MKTLCVYRLHHVAEDCEESNSARNSILTIWRPADWYKSAPRNSPRDQSLSINQPVFNITPRGVTAQLLQ